MSKLTETGRGKHWVTYKDEKGVDYIKLERVRASYPFVGTPSEDEDDEGNPTKAWRITGMLPKGTHVEAKDKVKELIQKLITTNEAKVPMDKWFLSNGDDKEAAEMQGHFLVTASDKKRRPTVRNQKGEVMDDIAAIDDKFYGGCWVNILLRPWFFDGKVKGAKKSFPKRVSAGLVAVQFVKDDTPFGQGRVDDEDVWDTVDDDGGEEDDGNDGL